MCKYNTPDIVFAICEISEEMIIKIALLYVAIKSVEGL